MTKPIKIHKNSHNLHHGTYCLTVYYLFVNLATSYVMVHVNTDSITTQFILYIKMIYLTLF